MSFDIVYRYKMIIPDSNKIHLKVWDKGLIIVGRNIKWIISFFAFCNLFFTEIFILKNKYFIWGLLFQENAFPSDWPFWETMRIFFCHFYKVWATPGLFFVCTRVFINGKRIWDTTSIITICFSLKRKRKHKSFYWRAPCATVSKMAPGKKH